MPSLPASQLVEDGEADGAYASPACDPDSEEPPVINGGARKSVSLPNHESTDTSIPADTPWRAVSGYRY